jgi:hypothetical protein
MLFPYSLCMGKVLKNIDLEARGRERRIIFMWIFFVGGVDHLAGVGV